MPDTIGDFPVPGKDGGLDPAPSDPTPPVDGFRWTRKQLIAMGAPVKPLTREEYLLSGDKESVGSPLNVKEQVLASVVGGGEEPTGTITITENGTGINVAQYATADVAVPSSAPGYAEITLTNGTQKTIYAPKLVFANGLFTQNDSQPVIISKATNKTIVLPFISSENRGLYTSFIIKAASSSDDWSGGLSATTNHGTVRVLGAFRPADDPADNNYRAVLQITATEAELNDGITIAVSAT